MFHVSCLPGRWAAVVFSLLALFPAEAAADEPPAQDPLLDGEISEEDLAALLAGGEVIEIEQTVSVTPGSTQRLGEEQLERFERDDIHHVLLSVPGVYVREEDGFGLRPNIGMRGVSSERSAKIALMEDGVLLAPAPYAAPAAYYFPNITRLQSIDVLKGPAAIIYGPNTVGGSVNLISQPIPLEPTAEVDAALGSDTYRKLYLRAGDTFRYGGLAVEGSSMGSNGFKRLDGGGNTGFVRNEVVARGRVNSDPDLVRYHQLDLKLTAGTETSDETYTGLSDQDFADTPYRRYAATQLDRMEWNRTGGQATYTYQAGGAFEVATTAYHYRFHRVWDKLASFAGGRDIAGVLAAPDAGSNQLYYQLLTGEVDSTGPAEALVLGKNDRTFVSQGVQSIATYRQRGFGFDHEVRAGIRLHRDSAHRYHTEDQYFMREGTLIADDNPAQIARDSTARAFAAAAWVQDQATHGRLTITAGLRTELISSSDEDHLAGDMTTSERYGVLIPGGGVFYKLTEWAGVLGGVHRGFVPVAPGKGDQASPESSINYEAGARVALPRVQGEVIGFFSDYQNLKGTCSFSAGCDDMQVEDEFDGGEVHTYGVEATARGEVALSSKLWLPMMVSYTLTRSAFQTSFLSDNPSWGMVEAGDEVPYLPEHQLAAEIALRTKWFETSVAMRHSSAMREVAGTGEPLPGEETSAHTVFDAAVHGFLGDFGEGYITVDNIADRASIVARRPYGARPGKPRTVILGYKNHF